jgi:hypothetical protein
MMANQDALDRLLALARDLRRNNPKKWSVSLVEWQSAVSDALNATELRSDDRVVEAIRAVRNAVRRLANSGEARFGSAAVGREPDSSIDGRRFCDDLEVLGHRLQVLRGLSQQGNKQSY